MHVSMLVRRSAALVAILAAASACSDNGSGLSAPRPAERPPFDVTALQPLDARAAAPTPHVGRRDADDSESTLDIWVNPNDSRAYAFGQNWIYFPAHSICDPATSGYGVGLWDTPCDALRQPITITVHWSNKGGHAYARFSPELRFVPATARAVNRWVVLSLHDQKRLHDVNDYNILYYGGQSIGWVNEQLQDPTLKAWIDRLSNSVSRRIKHFSGYMLAAGFADGLGGTSDVAY